MTSPKGWLIRRGIAVLFLILPRVAAPESEQPGPRPRIGLALGGGSAKGIAHVGVLQWLEEHRVPVDAIAGTSSGAFIGGAYATGLSATEIKELLRTADWDMIMRPDIPYALKAFRRKEDDLDYPIKIEAGLRHGFRLQTGLNPGHGIGRLLSRVAFPYSATDSFDDLAIPFRCLATDLETGDVVVLDRGPLGLALRASMAFPGTFDPVRLNGRLLSDGGILNNVPVDVARAMGVDVVIAVSLGAQERDTPAETIGAVANRALGLMMESLDQPRLHDADVVILPDLEEVRSSGYRRSDEVAALGYAGAEAQADRLLRYALDEVAWAQYKEGIKGRRYPRTGPVRFIEVTGVSDSAAAQIVDRFGPDLLLASDPTTIEAQLDWIVGQGRYASAMYDRRVRGDVEGLGIEVRDKSYGPPFVRFSLDLDNESKDLNLTLGSRITLMDITTQGSEWRIDTSVGSTLRAATELLQPLGGGGPLRRGAFLAPRAFYSRVSEDLYVEGELAAIDSRQRVGAGLDLGWIFRRTAQFRMGYESAYVRNDVRIGRPLFLGAGEEGTAHIRFTYDGQDKAYFRSHGARFASAAYWRVKAPQATGAFGRVEAELSIAWKMSARHQFTVSAEGGTSFGAPPPMLYQFSLGGPFRLGALPPNAIRGPAAALVRANYRTPLTRLPSILGDRLYLTGMVEVGSVFDRLTDARIRSSLTAGLAADTLIGPLFVGASFGNGGAVRAYFIIGTLVR